MTGGIGDLLHPRGAVPQPAVYELIGNAYAHVEACEPFVAGGRVAEPDRAHRGPGAGRRPRRRRPGRHPRAAATASSSSTSCPPTAPLDPYELVLVPETTTVDEALRAALRGYLAQGGALLLSGTAGLDAEGQPLLPEQGVESGGPSPFSHTFLRPAQAVAGGIPEYDHVTYETGPRIKPAPRGGIAGGSGGALLRAPLRALFGALLYRPGAALPVVGGGAQRPRGHLRLSDPRHLRAPRGAGAPPPAGQLHRPAAAGAAAARRGRPLAAGDHRGARRAADGGAPAVLRARTAGGVVRPPPSAGPRAWISWRMPSRCWSSGSRSSCRQRRAAPRCSRTGYSCRWNTTPATPTCR